MSMGNGCLNTKMRRVSFGRSTTLKHQLASPFIKSITQSTPEKYCIVKNTQSSFARSWKTQFERQSQLPNNARRLPLDTFVKTSTFCFKAQHHRRAAENLQL